VALVLIMTGMQEIAAGLKQTTMIFPTITSPPSCSSAKAVVPVRIQGKDVPNFMSWDNGVVAS